MPPTPPPPPPLPPQKPTADIVALADCLNGTPEFIAQFPYLLRETNAVGQTIAVEFQSQQGTIVLAPAFASAAAAYLNGVPLTTAVSLPARAAFTLQIGHRLLILQASPPESWPPEFNPALWQIFSTTSGKPLGEAPPSEILSLAAAQEWEYGQCAICPKGLDTGFILGAVADILATPSSSGTATDTGRFFCPACWLRFDAGDALSIATHESLRNDPVLGTDIMLRFFPTRFNNLGQAIDPMGLPATEIACPHCRRQLPPGFLELPHKILSLIGAPSAGKSYYLAVLTRVLQEKLYQDFGIVFKDGDPTGNILLNQMRTKLFSAATPEDCVLGKTAMEGATYERLPRFGKWVALPRPFVYTLGSAENAPEQHNAAVIFYDNAGEHFEPGHSMDDSPGALHVVSSAGIFFLYDPTSNIRFRKELADIADPQLRQTGRADQQDSILAEMEVRVKKMLGLAPADKIPVPIAILVGKCDVWRTLLDARELPRPVHDGRLDNAILDSNSAKIRELLTDLCPGLVAHAESLSPNVRYFAISSLGHSPSALESGPNAGLLAPDPRKLDPIGVEIPAYWLLSKAMPELIK